MGSSRSLTCLVVTFTLATLMACTRAEVPEGQSLVSIVAPKRSALESKLQKQGLALPSHLKPCFGVNVNGPGIPDSRQNSCSPQSGASGGTVGAGETLSVLVPRGSDRNFELYVNLVQSDEACPVLDANLLGNALERGRAFVAGNATLVSTMSEESSVEITLEFPGLGSSINAAANAVCLPPPALRATVLSNGDFVAPGGASMPGSPVIDSIFSIPLPSSNANGLLTATGYLGSSTTGFTLVPPWLYSVTRKPDLGTYFALDQENHIYQIDPIYNADAGLTKLSAASCPFDVADCKAPAWIHAVSAGYGRSLYGMDVEGRVYSLGAGTPTALAVFVDPIVQGFVFY